MSFFENNTDELAKAHTRDKQERTGDSDFPEVLLLDKGITSLRILPAYSASGLWYRELKEHWLLTDEGKRPFLCPRMNGEKCPICEAGDALYNAGGEANLAAAKELRARTGFLFNAVVYSTPKDPNFIQKGVVALKAGAMVKKGLLDLDQDHAGGWGDITNIEDGVDIRIEKRGEGLKTEYLVKGVPRRTNLVQALEAADLSADILEPINLDNIYSFKSYEDLQGLLDGEGSVDDELEDPPVVPEIVGTETPVAAVTTEASMPELSAPPVEGEFNG